MRILTLLLCSSLLWQALPTNWASAAAEPQPSEAEILERYPNARVYRVTESQFRRIRPHLNANAVYETVVLAQADLDDDITPVEGATNSISVVSTNSTDVVNTNSISVVTTNDASSVTNGPAEPVDDGFIAIPPVVEQGADATHHAGCLIDDRTCTGMFDLIGDLDGLGSDAAIVIFIVVGVTVVAAVIFYSAALLYRAGAGVGDHDYWWDTEVHAATIAGGDGSGAMAGLRIGSGVDLQEARLGLILEGGYIDAEIETDDQPDQLDQLDIEGGFLMGGAGVRWPLGSATVNASFLGVELLAGKVWDSDVDLLSVARATLSLGLREHLRLGFSLGALYLGLDADDAIIEDADNFTTLLGIEAGVRF